LVDFCTPVLVRIIFVGRWDGIDRVAGAVGSHVRLFVHFIDTEAMGGVLGEGSLGEVNRDVAIVVAHPFKSGAKEIVGFSHPINFDVLFEFRTEQCFFLWIGREVDKVIDVQADEEFFTVGGWIGGVDDTGEEAWVVGRWLEAHFGEYIVDHVVPMARGSAKTIQCFVEKPVLILVVCGIANRWTDDSALICGKKGIAEGIFAVTLLENAFFADGFGCEETEGGVLEDWCIAFGLCVVPVFKISKHDDARFGSVGFAIFIEFDTDDAHGWKSVRN